MEQRILGPHRRIGLQLCLGTMMFGAWGNRDQIVGVQWSSTIPR